ncbi:cytochrome P450 [Marasmius fiardii PR-910]|nr:cytochrome P450 [Marasmius fiardii PR-910]
MTVTHLAIYPSCLLVFYLLRWLYKEYTSPLRPLPGPPNRSLIFGNLEELRAAGSTALYERWTEKYGLAFRYKGFFRRTRLYIADTKAVNHVLMNHYDYHKPDISRFAFVELLGNGVLTTEEDEHKFQRKVMNPAFGPAQIRKLTSIFVEKAIELRDAWQHQIDCSTDNAAVARFEALSWLSRATLDIIGLAGFNYDFRSLSATEDKPDELSEAFKTVFSGKVTTLGVLTILKAMFPVLRPLPTGRGKLITNARATMERVGSKLVTESKRAAASEDEKSADARDLLSLLIKSNLNEDEKERMNDADVLAQIPTFLLAGHETTSTATAWALYALTQHPSIQCRLRDELLTLPIDSPTMDELNALPFLEAVVRETLRVHTPVPGLTRDAARDGVIPLNVPVNGMNHIRVKKGQGISISLTALNRSAQLWGEDAAEFKPDRWLNGSIDSSLPGIWGNMMTFGGGGRACIGFRFSLVEIKALLFTLVRAFEFELAVPKEDISTKILVVERPYVKSDDSKETQLPLLVKNYSPDREISSL